MISDSKFTKYQHIARNIRGEADSMGFTIPEHITDRMLVEIWDSISWPDDLMMIECIVGEVVDDEVVKIIESYKTS